MLEILVVVVIVAIMGWALWELCGWLDEPRGGVCRKW